MTQKNVGVVRLGTIAYSDTVQSEEDLSRARTKKEAHRKGARQLRQAVDAVWPDEPRLRSQVQIRMTEASRQQLKTLYAESYPRHRQSWNGWLIDRLRIGATDGSV